MFDIVQSIINTAPIIQKVFPYDSMIVLANREEFIFYLPGDKLKHPSPVGKKLSAGDGLWEAINKKQSFSTLVPKEVWGISFKNVSTPLYNEDNEIVGALGFGYSLENQEILQDAVCTIVSSSQEILVLGLQLWQMKSENYRLIVPTQSKKLNQYLKIFEKI